MDPQPDVIRQQIEDTRSSLTEKLETLEAEVKGTVQSAKDTVESAKESVQETISSVKETVHDATESVKRNLDLHYQVNQHPWAMMGLSLVSGAIAGALLGSRMSPDRRLARRMAEASREPPLRHEAAPAAPSRPGFIDRLTGQLGDEVEKAKDLAIKTVIAVVDDVIQRSIPQLGSAAEDMMSRAATNFAHPPQHGEERPEPVAGYGNPPLY